MRKILVGLIILLFFSCNEKPNTKFLLSGTTNGFEDGAMIYIDYNGETLDSSFLPERSRG